MDASSQIGLRLSQNGHLQNQEDSLNSTNSTKMSDSMTEIDLGTSSLYSAVDKTNVSKKNDAYVAFPAPIAASSSSPSSTVGCRNIAIWNKVKILSLFFLHNVALLITIVNIKLTDHNNHESSSMDIPECNRNTSWRLFLHGMNTISNETAIEASPVPLVNNIWMGLAILQNIWICYCVAGLYRVSKKGRYIEHLGIPSNALISSYLHAAFGTLAFYFCFDRKYIIASLFILIITAIYALKAASTFILDFKGAEGVLSVYYPRDIKFYPLLAAPLAAWVGWIVLNIVHLSAIICVHRFHCDDEVVSIITACIVAVGNLIFVIIDVTKLDEYTRRVLGPYVFICLFTIGGVINPIPHESPSKKVVIASAAIACSLFLFRIVLMCYRNKRSQSAVVRKQTLEPIRMQSLDASKLSNGQSNVNPCFVLKVDE